MVSECIDDITMPRVAHLQARCTVLVDVFFSVRVLSLYLLNTCTIQSFLSASRGTKSCFLICSFTDKALFSGYDNFY